MDRRARASAPRGSLPAVAALAVAAAVTVVLAYTLVVPLLNTASEIPDGQAHVDADYRDGVRHQFQQDQEPGG